MVNYHYQSLAEQLAARGMDVEQIKVQIKAQQIELPSWGFANTGTRFKTYAWPGAASSIHEKLADAGMVNKLTGVCPSVALHIPWDKTNDWPGLAQFALQHGVRIGAINTNTFQADRYKFGSLTHADADTRQKALVHHYECIEIMQATGSTLLSLWYGDGTNYAGQENMRARRHRAIEFLSKVHGALPHGITHVIGIQVL